MTAVIEKDQFIAPEEWVNTRGMEIAKDELTHICAECPDRHLADDPVILRGLAREALLGCGDYDPSDTQLDEVTKHVIDHLHIGD